MVSSKQYGNRCNGLKLKIFDCQANFVARDAFHSFVFQRQSPEVSVSISRRNHGVSQILQCLHTGQNIRGDAAQVK